VKSWCCQNVVSNTMLHIFGLQILEMLTGCGWIKQADWWGRLCHNITLIFLQNPFVSPIKQAVFYFEHSPCSSYTSETCEINTLLVLRLVFSCDATIKMFGYIMIYWWLLILVNSFFLFIIWWWIHVSSEHSGTNKRMSCTLTNKPFKWQVYPTPLLHSIPDSREWLSALADKWFIIKYIAKCVRS